MLIEFEKNILIFITIFCGLVRSAPQSGYFFSVPQPIHATYGSPVYPGPEIQRGQRAMIPNESLKLPNKEPSNFRQTSGPAEEPFSQEIPSPIQSHLYNRTKNPFGNVSLEFEEEEPEDVYYRFDTSINDTISDQTNIRSEVRNGQSLKGFYSYSDGYIRRTVHYEADENGYRVVKEETKQIGNGPLVNPNGKAEIKSSLAGEYSVTIDDYQPKGVKNLKNSN